MDYKEYSAITRKHRIYVLLVGLFFLINSSIFAQTASVTKGCSPLEVKFTSASMSAYYWEFIEGNATSTLQNPKHIFTHPGNYKVKLYEGQGGKKIGEINIKVYEDPIVNFTADTTSGCTPLTVSFTSDVSLDSEIKILGYKWAFGDGEESTAKNPIHIYTVEGEFKVSLEIITDIVQCDVTYNIEKYVKTNQLNINFIPSRDFICDYTGKIKFNNITPKEDGDTYHWDFGNGETSTEYNPDTVFYTAGDYIITLTIYTPEGCVFQKQKSIHIGKPVFDLNFPDTACFYADFLENPIYPRYDLNFPTTFENRTNIDTIIGTVELPNVIVDSLCDSTKVFVNFKKEGINKISFRIYNSNYQCYSDTTITVFVEKPDPEFELDPYISCHDPAVIDFLAKDSSFVNYHLLIKGENIFVNTDKPYGTITYDAPEGDSLFWHLRKKLKMLLTVKTRNSCYSTGVKYYVMSEPNAHFAPDVAQGCAPLTVTFSDSCESIDPIVWRKYTYSTGDSTILYSDEDHEYTFEEPGDYYVKLFIETESGCLDTSAGEWIRVGEPIAPIYEIDKTEICLGDSIKITFKNDDPRIDAVHVNTDNGRFNQCWKDKNPTHVFTALPGEYPVVVTAEYNGCYVYDTASYNIKVNGAKADLGYSIDCAKPNSVKFTDKSINANKLIWTIDGDVVLDKTDFEVNFEDTGLYSAKLEAIDTESGCTSTFDSVEFAITNIKAKLETPDKICDSEQFILDASKSVDVNRGCSQSFTWLIPTNPRPIRTWHDSIPIIFPRGDNTVVLMVEDVNGCKDTIIKHTKSYGIDLDISFDKDTICVPTEVQVINNSTSDTTLTWSWQNGSTERAPVFSYDKSYIYDYTNVDLRVTDALGCMDSFFQQLIIYRPDASIFVDPQNNLCVGDELHFSASEFTSQGSKLSYIWNLEGVDTFYQKDNSVIMDKAGLYPLFLHFTEENSGCSGDSSTLINVVNTPIADFYSDADNISPLCYPQILTFNDTSTIDGPGYIRWNFKDVTLSNTTKKTQVIEFPKGKHEVSLVANSFYGCSDTITKSFVVVGPEGKVISDKFSICIGDTIEFTLIDQVDVNSYKWDFGDGITIIGENPVKHKFDRAIDTTDAKIILKSTDNCEVSIDIPLLVNKVIANFEKYDTSVFCTGHAYLNNLSIGANKFLWQTEGEIEDAKNPIFIKYPGKGTYEVTLKAINTTNNCEDEITKTISVEEFNAFYIIPNVFTPNGDGENDTFGPVVTNDDFEGNIKFTTFKIYNRWGNLVYDNNNPDIGWDGVFDGKEAPAGTYGYYMEVDINECETIIKQGNVTLIR